MHLNATSQYALRIVGFMAAHEQDLYTAKALSEKLGISYKYLTAIMTNLCKAGIISSTRGRGGGFTFTKALGEISLYNVLEVMNKMDEKECVLGSAACNAAARCFLHDAWEKPKNELFGMYKGMTLEDVKKSESALTL